MKMFEITQCKPLDHYKANSQKCNKLLKQQPTKHSINAYPSIKEKRKRLKDASKKCKQTCNPSYKK